MKISCAGFILAGFLLAHQGVDASCQGDISIVTQQDMNQIRDCKSYSGNIMIDNSGVPDLSLVGVELIEGDLVVSNNNALLSFSLPKLQGINGHLKFSNNKNLASIDMKQLYALRALEVTVHPALNEIKFPAGLAQADKITITDSTIAKLEGLKFTTAKEIEITNNIYLKSLSFANMTSAGSVLISANSPALHIDLGKVETIREGAFRNAAEIILSSLKKVNGDISFNSNSFESLDLPYTSDISGTLTLTDNMQLNNLSLPQLVHLGGALAVNSNTKLNNINAFPALQQVDGTLDITGGFDEVQLPLLNDVRGGLNVQTSSSVFSCDTMSKLKAGVIKGNSFFCKSAVASPKSVRGGKGGGSGGSSSMEESSAAFLTHSGYALLASALLAIFVA